MIEGKTLVFDLYGTIMHWAGEPTNITGFRLRDGIKELFAEYKLQGNRIYITTAESDYNAGLLVEKAELTPYLSAALCAYRDPRVGKYYGRILQAAELTPEQASADMIITGDSHSDAPADLKDVVFIFERYAINNRANVNKLILEALLDKGKGSFIDGYNQILGTSESSQYNICDGLTISLLRKQSTPTIEVVI